MSANRARGRGGVEVKRPCAVWQASLESPGLECPGPSQGSTALSDGIPGCRSSPGCPASWNRVGAILYITCGYPPPCVVKRRVGQHLDPTCSRLSAYRPLTSPLLLFDGKSSYRSRRGKLFRLSFLLFVLFLRVFCRSVGREAVSWACRRTYTAFRSLFIEFRFTLPNDKQTNPGSFTETRQHRDKHTPA